MRQKLQPVRGRQLLVECLEGTWDFQAWFRKLHGQISGWASTLLEPDVNHVWRFASYGKLQNIMPESKLQVMRNDWADMEPDDKDVVLLLKESMHLQGFSQEPVLLLPRKVAVSLAKADLKPATRSKFGEPMLKQYRKTATAVAQPPWNFMAAQSYLSKLCDTNERCLPS